MLMVDDMVWDKVIEAKLSIECNSINNNLIQNKLTLHPGKCGSMLFASQFIL